MKYIELSFFLLDRDYLSDIIVAKLNEIEFESYVETEDGVNAYRQEQFYNKEKLNLVLSELQNLFSFDYSIKDIKQENWNSKWEESFEPVEINEQCIIRAQFHKKVDCEYEIIITPKMSFGTGHHETTFLMMNEMFSLNFKGKSVLDMGCGTGVLAILSKIIGIVISLSVRFEESLLFNNMSSAGMIILCSSKMILR